MGTLRENLKKRIVSGEATMEDVNFYFSTMTELTASNEEFVKKSDPEFHKAMIDATKDRGTPEEILSYLNIVRDRFISYKEEAAKNIGTGKVRSLEESLELYTIAVQVCESKAHILLLQNDMRKLKPIFEEYRDYFQQELDKLKNPNIEVSLELLCSWWKSRNHGFNDFSNGTFDGLYDWVNSVRDSLKNSQGKSINRESLRVKYNENSPTKNVEESPIYEQLDELYKSSN